MTSIEAILGNSEIISGLSQAWLDSKPGLIGGHEEGGFIVRLENGPLHIHRWQRGTDDLIDVPDHPGCMYGGSEIVASFHTHPNTGPNYLQEPSQTDKRGVRDDLDLKGAAYVGELVISARLIYLVQSDASVLTIGPTNEILV